MADSNFDPIFPKYGIKSDPYFREALKIEGSNIPVETLVGREKEKAELGKIIQKGGGQCCLVVGDAGVGKTSFVNHIRGEAIKSSYFSPFNEIGIEDTWKVTDVIINTLQALYLEIKRKEITIQDKTFLSSLEELFEISLMLNDNEFKNNAWAVINTQTLMQLFRRLCKEIIDCGYRSIIIQYNNLDNFDDPSTLEKLLNNLRDFFQTSNVIFIFIGDQTLPHIVSTKARLRQIFTFPEIDLPPLSYYDINRVVDLRMEELRLNPKINIIKPHSEEALKLLYQLHQGNIRDILNSLSNSLDTHNITTLSAIKTKKILIEKAKERFLNKLSPNEKKVLNAILKSHPINNSELAEKLNIARQHISSHLSKLKNVKAIKLESIDGRKEYYKPTAEALWLKLTVNDNELVEEEKKKVKNLESLQRKLKDFQQI